MYAHELIGKRAIRTKPVTLGKDTPSLFSATTEVITKYDYSFTTYAIQILAATESHIIYKPDKESDRCPINDDYYNKSKILDCRYCDDGWTDYDSLMKLAEPSTIKLMQDIHSIVNNVDDFETKS